MMKQILFLISLVFGVLLVSAQGGQIAVLYHENDFKTFYSSEALKDALASASDGDVITLSPGTFEGTNITKAVTIRGAGCGALDSLSNNNIPHTLIGGSFNLKIPSNDNGYTLSIEGVEFKETVSFQNVDGAIFSKVKFNTMNASSYDNNDNLGVNLTFFHCVIKTFADFKKGCNLYNCYIGDYYRGSTCKYTEYTNCILEMTSANTYDSGATGNIYRNCIFVSEYESSLSDSGPSAYNCIWVGSHDKRGPFYESNANPERHNKLIPENIEIFEKGTFYKLNENGVKYLGNDGTQVGLYGTTLPFSQKTSYPQLKKFTVFPETTSDGKLKIEFELNADN